MKDVEKLMSRTLITYFIILIGIFILKICGLDYFGLDTGNKIIVDINDFISKYHLQMVWSGITLMIYQIVILSISCIDNSKQMTKYAIFTTPASIFIQYFRHIIFNPIMFIFVDLLWLFMLSMVYIKFIKKEKIIKTNIGNYLIYMCINLLFQILSIVIRDINIKRDYYSFSSAIICNFDYILLSLISYNLFFRIGGKSLCHGVVSLFSHLQTLLKSLPTKLQNVYAKNKKKSKAEKVSDMIYVPLFILWNIFTVVVILFVAKLNDTFIECMIILSSFWINKKIFGKPFHMKTALSCFIISNLSYYCLDRITFPLGISLLIAILLGLLLSYVTSLFVKKKEKQLYRGMPKNVYDEYVTDIIDKDSVEYLIGKYYYVDNESEQWITNKLNYSVSSIQKKKYILRDTVRESK